MAVGGRRTVVAVTVLLGAIVVAGLGFGVVRRQDGSSPDTAAPGLHRARIVRTDLVATKTIDGTLGFTSDDPVLVRIGPDRDTLTGWATGTVTSAPVAGDVLHSGDVVYRVDDRPVVLLAGELPSHRTLSTRSADGPDVRQLEAALVALGYDPDGEVTVDEDFTAATRRMVERWQEDLGVDDTGVVRLGDVLFHEDPLVVAEVLVRRGTPVQGGEPVLVANASPQGTITALPEEGTVLVPGDLLYRIDEEPVVLLAGPIPAWRSLATGTTPGPDVRQLEENLVAFGFDPGPVDGVFDARTRAAVVAWQTASGAPADGVVDFGEVVFRPDSLRVAARAVAVGAVARDGLPVLEVSTATTLVTAELDAADQDLVAVGDAVTVELPDGTDVPGTVTDRGAVAVPRPDGSSVFELEITLDDPTAGAGLDEAPVDVDIVTDRADGVLAAPVTALLALAEGGYAVEVIDGPNRTHLVGVEPGLYADGLVELTGTDLDAGMEVVVP